MEEEIKNEVQSDDDNRFIQNASLDVPEFTNIKLVADKVNLSKDEYLINKLGFNLKELNKLNILNINKHGKYSHQVTYRNRNHLMDQTPAEIFQETGINETKLKTAIEKAKLATRPIAVGNFNTAKEFNKSITNGNGQGTAFLVDKRVAADGSIYYYALTNAHNYEDRNRTDFIYPN